MTTEEYRALMIDISKVGMRIRDLKCTNPESEADKFNVLTKIREASHYLQDINYREHPDQVLMAVDVKQKVNNVEVVASESPSGSFSAKGASGGVK